MFGSIDKSAILFSRLNFVLKCVEKWLPLWKNLKLLLEQNVTKQTYPKICCRSQKCLVQLLNRQFYLVNWILFSNMSRSGYQNFSNPAQKFTCSVLGPREQNVNFLWFLCMHCFLISKTDSFMILNELIKSLVKRLRKGKYMRSVFNRKTF